MRSSGNRGLCTGGRFGLESEWRWNVWNCGWSNSPIDLIARLAPPWDPFGWLIREAINPGLYILHFSASLPIVGTTWTTIPGVWGNGFPYFFVCEPD